MRGARGQRGALAPRTPLAVAGGRASASAGRGARPHRRADAAGGDAAAPAQRSPLVTTITKIVDVVPFPVRLLLGLLLSLSLALAARSRMVALRARKAERQRRELLEDVGLLQAALLPRTPARLGVVGVSAAYRPAEGPGAGGDFYDVFALDDGRVAAIVGDISGHGRQALPHTALVRFTLRAYMEAGLSPRVAVQTAGSVLERQLGASFATVVVATYDPDARTLVYACAGHPPPLVSGAAQDAAVAPILACSSPPLGAGLRTGVRQTTVVLRGRARVCLYTDGVTDARVGGELYGAGRLALALAVLAPAAGASQLLGSVAEATDTRKDDMAACILDIAGGATAPEVLREELELDRRTPSDERAAKLLRACGMTRGDAVELIAQARSAAGESGTAVIEVERAEGRAWGRVRRENVAHLPTALAKAHAAAGATP